MPLYCVLVKGSCRGKMCDFWSSVKIRKLPIDELVQGLQNGISNCEEEIASNLDDAFSQYWTDFGIKDLRRLCEEQPDLCSKIKQAEERIRKTML